MSDPKSNPERPNTVQIQFFHPVSRNRDVLKFYKDWDTNVNLRWTIKKGVAITWESTNSILTAWKSRSQKQDRSHSQEKAPTTKIPRGQIQIIKASLAALAASEAQNS